MADDIEVTPGSGAPVATDDVGGRHYQRVKLTDGTADSATPIKAGGGTEGDALRVTIASDSTGVLSVDDNGASISVDDDGGSLTVDAPADSPVNVRLSDGSTPLDFVVSDVTGTGISQTGAAVMVNNISTGYWQALRAAAPGGVIITGDVAHDGADSGQPVKIGGRATDLFTLPTAVASGDRVNFLADRYGRQYVVGTDDIKRDGVYYYHSGVSVVAAAADGAATAGGGRFWLINPVGSSKILQLRKATFISQMGSALATPTSPRFTLEKFVFTGTASGAQVTPALRRTADSAATGSLRTAVTGMTISSAAVVCGFLVVAGATAVAYNSPAEQLFEPGPDDRILLGAGEGLVLRQADNGTTSDTRRTILNLVVEEYTP